MTRRVFERSEYGKLFSSAQSSAFHCETLNEYRVPFEKDEIDKFCQDGFYTPSQDDIDFQQMISADVSKGKIWQRVHVVDLPLTNYLRFEFACYDFLAQGGEDIRIIIRDLNGPPWHKIGNDFWIFDDETLVLMTYDVFGHVISRELVYDEPETMRQYRSVRDQALSAAVPLADFVDTTAEYYRDNTYGITS